MTYSTLNEWFLTLEKGHQALLVEDKWMLASAAFEAGIALGRSLPKEPVEHHVEAGPGIALVQPMLQELRDTLLNRMMNVLNVLKPIDFELAPRVKPK